MKVVNLRKTTERVVMNERIMVDKILVPRKLFLKLSSSLSEKGYWLRVKNCY